MRERNTFPPGWVWTTIGEITQPIEKVDPTQKPDVEFIYLDIASIDNSIQLITDPKRYRGADAPSRARQRVKANDVLFSTVRTYLKNIALVPAVYDGQVASTGFSVLRGEDRVLGQYLFYYCLTDGLLSALAELQRGTSYPAVRDGDVRAQRIPLPPLPEQRRIVAEIEKQFTRLDAGVAALRRVQTNLKRYRASVLKAACEGRLAPQDPADEPADRLLARVLIERRAKWEAEHPGKKYVEPAEPETDGLPALPVGWRWVTLEQLARGDRYALSSGPFGSALGTKDYRVSGVPVIRGKNVKNGTILLADMVHVSEEKALSLARSVANPGDLVVVAVGSSGQPAIVPEGLPRAILSQNCNKVSLVASLVMSRYVLITMQIGATQTQLIDVTTDTARSFLSLTNLKRTIIPLPPLSEQHRIVAEIERRLSVVAELEATVAANLARAGRLRQAVLKRAFEGRLVAQDPNDETADVLLARIRDTRGDRGGATGAGQPGRGNRGGATPPLRDRWRMVGA